jgi:Fe2+ or Zn2+ uptake regulation protein
MADIPSGKHLGTVADGVSHGDTHHHMNCPVCGRWFDKRRDTPQLEFTVATNGNFANDSVVIDAGKVSPYS